MGLIGFNVFFDILFRVGWFLVMIKICLYKMINIVFVYFKYVFILNGKFYYEKWSVSIVLAT